MTNPDIKIFVVCHKPAYVPDNSYLYPIQVGTVLADCPIEGMLHDNTGDNISEKNRSYCELTAQYWAWKNVDADYYGFFHYRRYLSFDPSIKRDDGWGNIAFDHIGSDALKELKLDPEDMRKLIADNDVITVRARPYPAIREHGARYDVYHEYGMVPFQHREDLNTTLRILLRKYPQFKNAVKTYMHSTSAYECNMFIARRDTFHNYAAWLFDILFEAEKEIDTSDYSVEEFRIFGYLGERLWGIYYTWLKENKKIKYKELPKTLFINTDPVLTLKPVYTDEIPVVLAANNRFVPYLGVMIQSLIDHRSEENNYDLIILHKDITAESQSVIQSLVKKIANITIRFAKVERYFDGEKLFVDQHLSIETYYRLIIPEIMPDYKKIVYLDCDMVINRDVADLFHISLEGKIIAACRDIDIAGQIRLCQNHWEKYANEVIKLNHPNDYFQAGVLIIDLEKLRMLTSSKQMIQIALSRKWRCHDQDVLNYICKNQIKYISQKWNVLMNWRELDGRCRMDILKMAPRYLFNEYLEARNTPYIVHYAGYQKPWDIVDCDLSEYFWTYARKTGFYEQLLCNTKCRGDRINMDNNSNALRKTMNVLLPYGTTRREVVKRVYYAVRHL